MKISYPTNSSPDWTHYDQLITVTMNEFKKINDKIIKEIKLWTSEETKYQYKKNGSWYAHFLKPLEIVNINNNKLVFLKLTQSRFIQLITKNKRILDRNTIIKIID